MRKCSAKIKSSGHRAIKIGQSSQDGSWLFPTYNNDPSDPAPKDGQDHKLVFFFVERDARTTWLRSHAFRHKLNRLSYRRNKDCNNKTAEFRPYKRDCKSSARAQNGGAEPLKCNYSKANTKNILTFSEPALVGLKFFGVKA
jgi:hypothetical protein